MTNQPKKQLQFVFRNSLPTETIVVLEPWGDEHSVKPKEKITLLAEGPPEGQLEIEVVPGRLLVYGWEGSVIEIYRTLSGPR